MIPKFCAFAGWKSCEIYRQRLFIDCYPLKDHSPYRQHGSRHRWGRQYGASCEIMFGWFSHPCAQHNGGLKILLVMLGYRWIIASHTKWMWLLIHAHVLTSVYKTGPRGQQMFPRHLIYHIQYVPLNMRTDLFCPVIFCVYRHHLRNVYARVSQGCSLAAAMALTHKNNHVIISIPAE